MADLYVADTHALVWHLFNPTRLSAPAAEAFARVDRGEAILHVPLVVVAETAMVIEKGRVQATLDQLDALLHQMAGSRNYQIGALDLDTVLAATRLTELTDIFDRLLVAEVRALGAALITRDEEITAARAVPVIW
ncbi:MAG TPA: PIN domain-containing protein [Anaerolineae bacterium]|nr:PIN domain-containing protein [Anaerolineae bacterium]